MIEYLPWGALAFVILQLWLMGSKEYRWGWWAAIVATILWGGWCLSTDAWAMLAQQMVIFALAVRALKNLSKNNY